MRAPGCVQGREAAAVVVGWGAWWQGGGLVRVGKANEEETKQVRINDIRTSLVPAVFTVDTVRKGSPSRRQ